MKKVELGPQNWQSQQIKYNTIEEATEENYWNLEEEVEWAENTTYSDGWERAGGESFMRVGYNEKEDPVLIQKSGNPDKTVNRGEKLENEGANIIPTIMLIEEEALESDEKTKGSQYQIFQQHVPETFKEKYKNGEVSENAVQQLGENMAAIYSAGFKPLNDGTLLDEMLCDGENTYVVDFGADLGSSHYENEEIEIEDREFEELLTEEDYEIFQNSMHL